MTLITINGEARSVLQDATLSDIIAAETGRALRPDGRPDDGSRLGLAAAKNAHVIPRSRWFIETITDGDAIELVTATQGG